MSNQIKRLGVLWLWVWIGCSAERQASSALKQVCVPGTVYSCVRGSCSGSRECLNDGSAMTPCECDTDASTSNTAGANASNPLLPRPTGGAGAVRPRDAGQATDASATAPGKAQDAGTTSAANKPEDAGAADPTNKPEDAGAPHPANPAPQDASTSAEPCARCVDPAPDGWRGPVALRSAADLPSCEGQFDQSAFEAGDQLESAAISCSTCTCQGGCSPYVDFGTSDAAQCGGTSCTTSINASCIEIGPQCLQGATTASLETALSSSAGCTPSTQEAKPPTAHWKTRVRACQPAQPKRAGCSAAQLCLPETPGDPFEPGYCIWREGEQACPGAPFNQRRLYHRELEDTRSCSPCTCAAPSCSYAWRVFNLDDTSCTSPVLQLTAAGQCAQINPVMGKLRVGSTITSAGACTPAGGESRGALTPVQPLTVCCDR